MSKQFSIGVNQGVVRLILLVGIIVGVTWAVVVSERPRADVAGSESTISDDFFSNRTIVVTASLDGEITVGRRAVEDTATRLPENDELRIKVFDGRETPLLGGKNITVELQSEPELPVTSSMRAYAIHGATIVDEAPTLVDSHTARWVISELESEGSVSIVVYYPPNSFDLGPRAWLRSLPQLYDWIQALVIGLLTTLVVYAALLLTGRRWKNSNSEVGLLNAPPSALSAGAAGALIKGKVGPSQLAATLIEMAVRGDIQIVQTPAGYRVARRRAVEALSSTEKILIDEMHLSLKPIASQEHVESMIGQELFNTRIADAYGGLLDQLRERGLLPDKPARGRVWYRFLALIFVLIAAIGATLTTVTIPDGVNVITFWIGPLLSGWLIFTHTPSITSLNQVGQAERRRWLAFRNYLSAPTPIGGGQAEARAFLLFLPYAISFDVVTEWLNRFNRDLINIPDWYFNTDNPAASAVFIEDIQTISQHIANDFARVATGE